MSDDTRKNFPHYHKPVQHLHYIDVYRVLSLFDVTNPAIAHAIKKLLVAGRRGAKDLQKDWREAVVSINRALQMIEEDAAVVPIKLQKFLVRYGATDSKICIGAVVVEGLSRSDAIFNALKDVRTRKGIGEQVILQAEVEECGENYVLGDMQMPDDEPFIFKDPTA